MANEYGNDIITLTDESGTELQFEHFGSVEMDGTIYVGLIELFDDPKSSLKATARCSFSRPLKMTRVRKYLSLSTMTMSWHVFRGYLKRHLKT